MPGNGLDVTRAGDAAAATALAEQEFGGLDVLVNNGGHGMVGAIEEGSPQEYRPLFETNVFGVIETTRAALPALRKAGGGRIVMVSSGAGIAGSAGSGYHNATKFAVEGLSEALAQEVAPFGIATIIVEPGPFRTEFLGRSMRMAAAEMPEYAGTAGGRRRYRSEHDGRQPGDPRKAIDVVLRAVDAEHPPLHLPLGAGSTPSPGGSSRASSRRWTNGSRSPPGPASTRREPGAAKPGRSAQLATLGLRAEQGGDHADHHEHHRATGGRWSPWLAAGREISCFPRARRTPHPRAAPALSPSSARLCER